MDKEEKQAMTQIIKYRRGHTVQQEHPESQACPEAPQDEQEQSPMMAADLLWLEKLYISHFLDSDKSLSSLKVAMRRQFEKEGQEWGFYIGRRIRGEAMNHPKELRKETRGAYHVLFKGGGVIVSGLGYVVELANGRGRDEGKGGTVS